MPCPWAGPPPHTEGTKPFWARATACPAGGYTGFLPTGGFIQNWGISPTQPPKPGLTSATIWPLSPLQAQPPAANTLPQRAPAFVLCDFCPSLPFCFPAAFMYLVSLNY